MSAGVLLIEGEDLIAEMIRMNLEDAGFRVDWVKSIDAVGETYDVIFLDLDFSGEDGIRALKDLRGRGVATPVMAVTASEDTQTKVDALEHGADAFLQKPFEIPEMIARLNALVRRL